MTARVTFRTGVYNSKNSKGWGTPFILGALLGYTKTPTEQNVLSDTCTLETRLHRFKMPKAALTYTSDSEVAAHSQD